MDSTERHDIINFISPALTYTQNLRLGFYGDLNEKQEAAVRKIEQCIKDLNMHLQMTAQSGSE